MSNISPGPRWLKVWIVILFTLFSLSIAHIPAAFAAVSSAADPALQLKIVSTRVNLRAGPGTNFAVIGGASQDEQFAVIGRNAQGTWYKINLSGGKTAWVNGGLVTIPGDASQIPVVKEDAPSTPAASNAGATTPVSTVSGSATGQASGRLLYSVANMDAKRWELWEYNFSNSENKKIADWRTEIDVSKDGKQIVYFAWPNDAGEKAGIWIMDADFSNSRLVVPGGAYPSFSPGGDRLVANGRDNLYVLTTDGKNIRGLTNGEYPAWSPINDQIVHRACVGGNCGLWLIDANSTDAGARTRLTTGGGDGQPAWSPDGKRIAYISKEDGNFEIYVINADSSNKLRLTTNPSSDGLPVWSPDGKWIAFRSDRDGNWAIYIMRPDGSDVRKVVDANVLPLWFFEKMDWR